MVNIRDPERERSHREHLHSEVYTLCALKCVACIEEIEDGRKQSSCRRKQTKCRLTVSGIPIQFFSL